MNSNIWDARTSDEILDPELQNINRGKCVSLLSNSFDTTDPMSSEDGSRTCATEVSSRPTSALPIRELQSPVVVTSEGAKKIRNDSIYVLISGTSFAVPRDAYQKMENLNWMDRDGVRHLDTSPAIFEVLLSHIIFESLPAYDTLSKTEYDEFEPLALSLELYALVEHFGRSAKLSIRRRRRQRQHPSSTKNGKRRPLLILPPKKQPKENKGTPIVLNKESASVALIKLMAVNSKCARFVASVKRKSVAKFGGRGIKTTHAELCNSDLIN